MRARAAEAWVSQRSARRRRAVAGIVASLAITTTAPAVRAEPVVFEACLSWDSDLARAGADAIPYRRITKADFRAPAPLELTPLVPLENAVVAAHVAVTVLCFADVRARSGADGRWTAFFEQLAFRAVLDRERSWWNHALHADEPWTLRHEQGHFDLAEVMARDLAREAPMIRGGLRGEGETPDEAVAALAAQWASVIGTRLDAHRWLQRQYDLETLHGNDTAVQADWWQRIFRDLRRTRPPD